MMSAYAVADSTNKYRHGVLIGNFVEDKFGRDLSQKGPNPDAIKLPTTKDHHDLAHSLYKTNPYLNNQQNDKSQFYTTARGVSDSSYKHPQKQTTYNIFHHQQVNKNVPLVENNPKRQQRLQKQGQLYDQTRYYLANKFHPVITQGVQDARHQQIPDILTGQIYKAKVNQGSQLKVDQKGKPKLDNNVNARSINPYGTYSIVKPQITKFEQVQYNKFVYPHHKGQHRDVLFGHGIALQEFQRRQLSTTYDLSYNQKVMPQTQVNSFYEPDFRTSAKQFHKQTFYEKNHQPQIPAYSQKKILGQQKEGRPYQPYTATFDYNHLKNEYLRK